VVLATGREVSCSLESLFTKLTVKNMHSEYQGNLAVYKVTAHPAKLMYAEVCILRSIFVNANARAQSHTLQDFLQLASIYRGLFAHSPLLAQDVHCVLLSRHELDVEPLPLVEHALQDNLQFANIYLEFLVHSPSLAHREHCPLSSWQLPED